MPDMRKGMFYRKGFYMLMQPVYLIKKPAL